MTEVTHMNPDGDPAPSGWDQIKQFLDGVVRQRLAEYHAEREKEAKAVMALFDISELFAGQETLAATPSGEELRRMSVEQLAAWAGDCPSRQMRAMWFRGGRGEAGPHQKLLAAVAEAKRLATELGAAAEPHVRTELAAKLEAAVGESYTALIDFDESIVAQLRPLKPLLGKIGQPVSTCTHGTIGDLPEVDHAPVEPLPSELKRFAAMSLEDAIAWAREAPFRWGRIQFYASWLARLGRVPFPPESARQSANCPDPLRSDRPEGC